MSNNLKVYFDAAQKADAQVKEVAARIDNLIETDQDAALKLRPDLEAASNKAKDANELYIAMKNAQSNDLPAFTPQAPAFNKTKLGDNFSGALAAYIRDNDGGGLRGMFNKEGLQIRNASNNTDMNIGTAADGGYVDPTGFFNQVIAKRSEGDLATKLGLRLIPGKGSTVDVPYDNEADGEFVSTNEAASYDQDAPALGQAQMTLVKYTKKITLSQELLEDEDANLMAFLSDWIGRGMAKTRNSLIVTEAGTSGTSYKTTASATAIAAGELEATAINDTVGFYLEDGGTANWVMRPSTFSAIKSITGNPRLYASETPYANGVMGKSLLEYPVYFSNKVDAIAASKKVAYFGNWYYMGYREAPGFTLLRDPYSAASTGQVVLHMYFRNVFKLLQPDAVGYLITHA